MKELRKKKKARLAEEKENAAKLNDTKEDLLRQLAAINEQQEAEALRIKQEKKAKKVAKTERKAAKAAKEEHDAEVAAEVARNAEAEAAKKEAKQAEVRRAHQAAKERAQRQKASKHKKEQKKRRHARGGGKEGGGVVPETPPPTPPKADSASASGGPDSGEGGQGDGTLSTGGEGEWEEDGGQGGGDGTDVEELDDDRCGSNLGKPQGPMPGVNGGFNVYDLGSVASPADFHGTGTPAADGCQMVMVVPSYFTMEEDARQRLKHFAELRASEGRDDGGVPGESDMVPDPAPPDPGYALGAVSAEVRREMYAEFASVILGGNGIESQNDSFELGLSVVHVFPGQKLVHVGKTSWGSVLLPVPLRHTEGFNEETKQYERVSVEAMTPADMERHKAKVSRDVACVKSGFMDALRMQGCSGHASTSGTASTRAGSSRVSSLTGTRCKFGVLEVLVAAANYQLPGHLASAYHSTDRSVFISSAAMKAPMRGDLFDTMLHAGNQLEIVNDQMLTQSVVDCNGERRRGLANKYKLSVDIRMQLQAEPSMRPLVLMHGSGGGHQHASEERATQLEYEGVGVPPTCPACDHPVNPGDCRGRDLFKAAVVDTAHQSGTVQVFPSELVQLECGCISLAGGVTYTAMEVRCTGPHHKGSRALGYSAVVSPAMVQNVVGMGVESEASSEGEEGGGDPVEGGTNFSPPGDGEQLGMVPWEAINVANSMTKLKVYNEGCKHLTKASGVQDKPTDELAKGGHLAKIFSHILAEATAHGLLDIGTAYALLERTYEDLDVGGRQQMTIDGFMTLVHEISQGNEDNSLVVEFTVNICDACRGDGETWLAPEELLTHRLDATPLCKFLRGLRGHPAPMMALCVPTVMVPIVLRMQELLQLVLATLVKGKDGYRVPGKGLSALAGLYKLRMAKANRTSGKRAKGTLAALAALLSMGLGVIGVHLQRTMCGRYSTVRATSLQVMRELRGALFVRGLRNFAETECSASVGMGEALKYEVGAAGLRRCIYDNALEGGSSCEGTGYFGDLFGAGDVHIRTAQLQHPYLMGAFSDMFDERFPGSLNFHDHRSTQDALRLLSKKGVSCEELVSALSSLDPKMVEVTIEGTPGAELIEKVMALVARQMQFGITFEHSRVIGAPQVQLGVVVKPPPGGGGEEVTFLTCLQEAHFLKVMDPPQRSVEDTLALAGDTLGLEPTGHACRAFLQQGSTRKLKQLLGEHFGVDLCEECQHYLDGVNAIQRHSRGDGATGSGLGAFPALEMLVALVLDSGPFKLHAAGGGDNVCMWLDTVDDEGEKVASGLRPFIRQAPQRLRGKHNWGAYLRSLVDQCETIDPGGGHSESVMEASDAYVSYAANAREGTLTLITASTVMREDSDEMVEAIERQETTVARRAPSSLSSTRVLRTSVAVKRSLGEALGDDCGYDDGDGSDYDEAASIEHMADQEGDETEEEEEQQEEKKKGLQEKEEEEEEEEEEGGSSHGKSASWLGSAKGGSKGQGNSSGDEGGGDSSSSFSGSGSDSDSSEGYVPPRRSPPSRAKRARGGTKRAPVKKGTKGVVGREVKRTPRHKFTPAETKGILEALLYVTQKKGEARPSEEDVYERVMFKMPNRFSPSAKQVGNKIKSLRKAYHDNNKLMVSKSDRKKYKRCLEPLNSKGY